MYLVLKDSVLTAAMLISDESILIAFKSKCGHMRLFLSTNRNQDQVSRQGSL